MSNLRDSLLDALKQLPGARTIHLHVLTSSPRKHSELYPFANPRPKTVLQDVLVLASEQATATSPRVLVAAIEASVYQIPSTNSGVLYVSKVDSTGQAQHPSPTTALVKALLLFYARKSTRPIPTDTLWIHVFARAQGQYLFPNSADFSGKYPLSDTKLCAWWKKVLTGVADELNRSQDESQLKLKLFYILPGFGKLEADNTIKDSSSPMSIPWTYSHPYSQTDIPLPCPLDSQNLGHFIPSFDDDPKSRFMDDLAYTTNVDGVKTPEPKRPRPPNSKRKNADELPQLDDENEEKEKEKKDMRPAGELGKVTPDGFWEQMSFRQECVAGAITGFFTLGIASSGDAQNHDTTASSQEGQVSPQIIKRILKTLMTGVEFSTTERAISGTETVENTIKGLCEGSDTQHGMSRVKPIVPSSKPVSRAKTPEPRTHLTIPSTLPEAPSRRRRRSKDEDEEDSASVTTFSETPLEVYSNYIYKSISISNPALGKRKDAEESVKAAPVNVLTVRKRKKPAK
jgi:regulator of Ty1 transposition protein 109